MPFVETTEESYRLEHFLNTPLDARIPLGQELNFQGDYGAAITRGTIHDFIKDVAYPR
jgi:hypothetical protein